MKNKFDSVKEPGFKFLKERLLLVRHLLRKNPGLDRDKRAELIRALLSENNLREALKVLPNSSKKKGSGLSSIASHIFEAFSGGQIGSESEEKVLKKEMRKIASAVSDSEFLLGLKRQKSIGAEGLQSAIEEAEMIAHTSLSSSIDATVKTITQAVLHKLQVRREKKLQKAIQRREARALSDALVGFIRDLNAKSAECSKP